MEKEFIPYEQALALKDLGFDYPCFGFYYTFDNKKWILANRTQYELLEDTYDIDCYYTMDAPLYQQVFKFFRDKYGYYVELFIDDYKKFGFMISYFTEAGRVDKPLQREYLTYEEAELACLKKLIEIVKEKI
jgi:hypothetical protein